MTIIRHPTLNNRRDVSESALTSWLAAGWITDDQSHTRRVSRRHTTESPSEGPANPPEGTES